MLVSCVAVTFPVKFLKQQNITNINPTLVRAYCYDCGVLIFCAMVKNRCTDHLSRAYNVNFGQGGRNVDCWDNTNKKLSELKPTRDAHSYHITKLI